VWRQDGSPLPVEVPSAPIKDGAEVIGAVLAFNDMTEAGELERRRARLLDVLAAELTPGLAKLSAQSDQEDLVARLRAIVADAIDYENLMTGQATPEPTAADLRDVVAEAVAARQQSAGERGVELLVHTVEAPAAADGPRLVLALSELIRAAVDATPAGGTVSVTLTGEHDLLRISVDGVEQSAGPAENPLLRWLRPRGSVGGADPDLALVQIVAEAHGGRFLLESKPDGIRSYVIELPRPLPPSTSARKHARNGAPPAPAPEPLPTAVIPPQPAMPVVPTADDLSPARPYVRLPDPAPPQVLVWPEPSPSLAGALLARGLASVALARPEQPVIVPVGTAVVFIDPGAGPLRRRRLVELGAAAAAAELPVLAVAGLAEVDGTDPAGDPAVLLNGLVPSGKVERVLIIEEDPALAAAFGAGLALAGVRGWHARSDVEAAGRLAHARPDVVLRNLGGPEPVDTVWLHGPDAPPIPVLAYTTDELAEGHQYRLERGQTVLGLCARLQNATVDQRLAVLLSRLSGMIG